MGFTGGVFHLSIIYYVDYFVQFMNISAQRKMYYVCNSVSNCKCLAQRRSETGVLPILLPPTTSHFSSNSPHGQTDSPLSTKAFDFYFYILYKLKTDPTHCYLDSNLIRW